MGLLIDLFGYLSIVIHGLTITAQSMALGGVLFIALLLRPIVARLGSAGQGIERTCIAITAWSALALVLCEAATVALQSAVLVGTVDLSIARRAARGVRHRRPGEGDRRGADRADCCSRSASVRRCRRCSRSRRSSWPRRR